MGNTTEGILLYCIEAAIGRYWINFALQIGRKRSTLPTSKVCWFEWDNSHIGDSLLGAVRG